MFAMPLLCPAFSLPYLSFTFCTLPYFDITKQWSAQCNVHFPKWFFLITIKDNHGTCLTSYFWKLFFLHTSHLSPHSQLLVLSSRTVDLPLCTTPSQNIGLTRNWESILFPLVLKKWQKLLYLIMVLCCQVWNVSVEFLLKWCYINVWLQLWS